MTRCEYCGQEDANLNVKGQFFHKECYQNFLKEVALEEKEQEINFSSISSSEGEVKLDITNEVMKIKDILKDLLDMMWQNPVAFPRNLTEQIYNLRKRLDFD